jgi:hypothetical protein
VKAHLRNKADFSFELYWLRQESYYEMIEKEWKSLLTGNSPMDRWLNKLRHIRRFLRGWAKNLSGKHHN